jgi:hypothetical protein
MEQRFRNFNINLKNCAAQLLSLQLGPRSDLWYIAVMSVIRDLSAKAESDMPVTA